MKTYIDSQKGVHIHKNEDGISLEGKDYHEAPFDQRWSDLRATLHEGTGPSALTYEAYRDTGYFMRFFRHNQSDKIFMLYQMPHGWDISTDVRPHMHMIPMANTAGTVSFNYAYTWAQRDEEFKSSIGWVSGTVNTYISSSDQYLHKKIHFENIQPPANAHPSSILIFKVERNTGAEDTYSGSKDHNTVSANIAILEFDLHYRKKCAGTVGEFE